jgi:nucleoside-diphosphate-sugar epimerase
VLAWRDRGAPAVVARVFNLVDRDLPTDNPVGGIVHQVRQAAAGDGGGRHPVTIGDPTTTRDLCPRTWVAEMVVALATRPPELSLVNVCSGRAISFGALAYDVADRLGAPITVRDMGWPRGGRVVGDPARLQSLVPGASATRIDDPATVLVGPAAAPRRHATSRHSAGEAR